MDAYSEYTHDARTLSAAEMSAKYESVEEHLDSICNDGSIPLEYQATVIRKSDGAKAGYRRTRGRTFREISHVVHAAIKDLIDEGFSFFDSNSGGHTLDSEWPEDVRWVAIYPVTGGSEGHYIHVDLVREVKVEGKYYPVRQTDNCVFLGKTFLGLAHAQKMCAKLQELFGV
jgi:hypothetical protein